MAVHANIETGMVALKNERGEIVWWARRPQKIDKPPTKTYLMHWMGEGFAGSRPPRNDWRQKLLRLLVDVTYDRRGREIVFRYFCGLIRHVYQGRDCGKHDPPHVLWWPVARKIGPFTVKRRAIPSCH